MHPSDWRGPTYSKIDLETYEWALVGMMNDRMGRWLLFSDQVLVKEAKWDGTEALEACDAPRFKAYFIEIDWWYSFKALPVEVPAYSKRELKG